MVPPTTPPRANSLTEGNLVEPGSTGVLATVQQLDPIYVDITQAVGELNKLRRDLASGELAKVPEETAGKDAVVAALKSSFAECDKAFAALTDTNLTEPFTIGPATRTRVGMMWGTVSHDTEQYAALALYLRLKGLAPPSSEK